MCECVGGFVYVRMRAGGVRACSRACVCWCVCLCVYVCVGPWVRE